MEHRHGEPLHWTSHLVFRGRISPAPEGGTDGGIQRRDLEAFQKVGRRPDRGNAEPEGPAFLAGDRKHSGKQRFCLFAEPLRGRPQADDGTAEHLRRAACLGRGLSKGSDYDRETGKFEFSGKEYIPDFIIPKLQLCIEVKLLRDGRKSKVIEEISADITAYAKQYERQLFVVYDLGVIQNKEEFRRDIENAGNVKLIIVKH